MKHLSSQRRLVQLLILLLVVACQGRGRVHEAPPASFPDADPIEAPAAPPPESESSPGEEGYAEPPAPSGNPSAPELEELSASAPAKPESAAALGRGQATTDAPARQRDDYRGSATSKRSLPEERPGLATHWGENRYSPARQVDFERSLDSRPSAVVELHYNDRAGARRMLPRGEWGRAEAWALGLHVSVVDASGRTLPALRSGSRVICVGAPGERYALQIENSTGDRYEIVASVDGLDVLDGEGASFEKRGYLIGAYSSVLIDGFRRSDAEVAAFRLGDVAGSYAASKGQARNVGVIGIALFDEKRGIVLPPTPRWRDRRWDDDTRQRRDADAFPGRYARPPVW
jgi:hypothetical protein